MSTRVLYRLRVLVAALANVPSEGPTVAGYNGQVIDAEAADIVFVTETWDGANKAAIVAATRHLDWHTHAGQSAMLGTNPARFRVLAQGVIRAGASFRIPFICDRRDVFWRLIEDTATGRKLYVLAVHTAPIRPKMGRAKVAAARVAHAAARRRLRAFVNRSPYPVLMGGDFNTTRLLLAAEIAGATVGNGIVHVESFNGRRAQLNATHVEAVHLESDHPGALVEIEARAAA